MKKLFGVSYGKGEIFYAFLIVGAMWQSATIQAQAQDASLKQGQTPGQSSTTSTTSMFADVTSLVRFVSDITPMLERQGNEADRSKLRGKLKSISAQLATTETTNISVVAILKSTNPDYEELRNKLNQLHDADNSIATSIAAIRSDLHLSGQTELERHASDAMSAKGIEVDGMLAKLQFSIPHTPEQVEALQTKSSELLGLIRQAEDAVANAYQKLQAPG